MNVYRSQALPRAFIFLLFCLFKVLHLTPFPPIRFYIFYLIKSSNNNLWVNTNLSQFTHEESESWVVQCIVLHLKVKRRKVEPGLKPAFSLSVYALKLSARALSLLIDFSQHSFCIFFLCFFAQRSPLLAVTVGHLCGCV